MRREFGPGGRIQEDGQLLQQVVPDKVPSGSTSQANKSAVGGNFTETPEEERSKERTLATVVFPICILLALLFEMYHMRWAEVDWNLQMDRSDGLEGSELVDNSFSGLTVGLFGRAARLGRIYFAGAGKVKGRVYVGMLVCHNLFGMQYLNLVNFDFQRRMWNIYQHPSMGLFAALIMNWVILYTCMTITAVYSAYTEGMLMIHWREHMTRYFEALWLPNSYAFRLRDDRRFDNPDQRIQEDVGGYVGNTYGLTLGLWNAVFSLAIYGYMLFRISPTSFFGYADIPGWLFYVAIAYSAVGSIVMQFLGSNLAHYSWLGERYGGDFRAELRRVFEQSETMAAVRSHNSELGRLQSRFEHVKMITWRSMILNKQLNWFNHFYGPFSSILFMCILMPFFIKGEVDLGRIKQCEMALGQVSGALNFFVGNYGTLAAYRATVDRLYNFRVSALEHLKVRAKGQNAERDLDKELLRCLAEKGLPTQWPTFLGGLGGSKPVSDSSIIALAGGDDHQGVPDDAKDGDSEEAPRLWLQNKTINLPSGEALLRDASLHVPTGQCVLLCGREGAGKSTLLRSLAGIWPFMEPGGEHCLGGDMILIPQKPRLPTAMSLRDAVNFPKQPGTFTDDEVRSALRKTYLYDLADGDLTSVVDVNSALSGGEFQRLMVSHCLLAKPRWILLDESMAHLSRENQIAIYTILRAELVDKCGTSLVSTSHDWKALSRFHDIHYMIKTEVSDESDGPLRRLVAFDPADEMAASGEKEIQSESVEALRLQLLEKAEMVEKLKAQCAVLQARVSQAPEEEREVPELTPDSA
jgi:putative ATP-binding cassette transporter